MQSKFPNENNNSSPPVKVLTDRTRQSTAMNSIIITIIIAITMVIIKVITMVIIATITVPFLFILNLFLIVFTWYYLRTIW